MKAVGVGQLRHMFHGDYRAVVAIGFADASVASAALARLGAGWKQSDKDPRALVWSGDSAALDALKEKFKGAGFWFGAVPCSFKHCRKRCKDAPIDSLAHSIDFGPQFSLEVECDDPRQESLF